MTNNAPPPATADDPRERRLIMRFYRLWEARAGNHLCPALTDLRRDDLAPFRDFSILIDLQEGYDNPALRFIGDHIGSQLDRDYKGAAPADAPRGSILSRVTDHYLEVLANRAPVAFEAEFKAADGREIPYRAILVPLSRHDDAIEFVMGVINWKGAAAVTQAESLTPAVSPPPVSPPPVAASSVDMTARLYDLRDRALAAGRSRRALYDLLIDIYDFWALAQSAPEIYAGFLAESGLKAQRRAPFTAVLKLVFGAAHDKTRLTEYAAALAHAQRRGWSAAALAAALNRDGGMKAMVRAERQARGGRGGATDPDALAAADNLPTLARIDHWPLQNSHGRAFLLLATPDGDDGLRVVAASDLKDRALAAAARRLLRHATVIRGAQFDDE